MLVYFHVLNVISTVFIENATLVQNESETIYVHTVEQ